MNHVFVAQEKSLSVVVVLYRNKETNNIEIDIKVSAIRVFLFCSISLVKLFCIGLKELKSSIFSMKPLFLPILKNLFFLSSKISSGFISLNFIKFFNNAVRTFCNIRSLSL